MHVKTAVLGLWFLFTFASAGDLLSGRLAVVWGDGGDGDHSSHIVYRLDLENGDSVRLVFLPEMLESLGDLSRFSGRLALAEGELMAGDFAAEPELLVAGFWHRFEDEPGRGGGISGSKPWITLPAKFSDIAAEPQNLSFFLNMYGDQPGQLNHYWGEVSSGLIDVVGSTAVDWLSLPQSQTFYVPTPGSGTSANLSELFNATVAAADPFVDFSNGGTGGYEGINLMFNGVLDCCAWGGSRFATLDGVTKSWRVTWEPPWGYADEAVIAHEMGHGFGLPHTNNSDGDSSPYDNPWDVMSAATNYAVSNPTYGRLGKHINAYHKDLLGWIPDQEIRFIDSPGVVTLTLEHLSLESSDEYRMVKIPINGSDIHYYLVESRDLIGDYDSNLPGNAVLIYEVNNRAEPSWLVDGDPIPATFSDNEGVMWRVGELFEDSDNDIRITIQAATAQGFVIEVDTRNCDSAAILPLLPDWPDAQTILDLVNTINCGLAL